MALQTPPSWLQAGSYTAEQDRLIQQAIYSTSGIVGASALAVTAQASPDMTVNIASGYGVIVGNGSPNLGAYVCYNNATTIVNVSTADATNPRIDRVVMTVNDAAYSGSTNNVVFTVIAGTAAASPTAPAIPANSISLATISVAAAATSITSANITNTRTAATSTWISTVSLGGGSMTGNITLVAGTTTLAPLTLTSGGLLSSGTIGGAIEYDGTVAYLSPKSTATATTNGGRALIATPHFYNLGATRTLTSASTAVQSMFGVGITLGAGVWEFEIVGTSSWTQTATITNLTATLNFSAGTSFYLSQMISGKDATTAKTELLVGGSATIYSSTASAGTNQANFIIKGMFRNINSSIIFTPQLNLSTTAASAFQVNAGTYVKLTPVGTSLVNSVGAWA